VVGAQSKLQLSAGQLDVIAGGVQRSEPLTHPVYTGAVTYPGSFAVCTAADSFHSMIPLTDEQWRIFRDRLEHLAEQSARDQQSAKVSHAELGEMLLLLMDRIDHLEKQLRDESAA
jgi:hypothetical protein